MKLAAVAILLFALLGACAQQESAALGAVLPLTGPGSGLGEVLLKGFEWKIEQLQAQGADVELIVEDSRSDPKAAVPAFRNLVDIRNVDIVLTALSGVSMALKPIAEEEDVLLWSIAAHPDLTKNTSAVIRHSNTVEGDADVIGGHLEQRGLSPVGILYQQDDWGVSLAAALEEELGAAHAAKIDHRASDFKTEILKIMDADPQAVIVIAVGPSAGIIVKQLRELGYGGDIYSSLGFVLTPGVEKIAGDAAQGMYYQTYAGNGRFESDYQDRFGEEPTPFHFIGYASMELLWHAIEETGSQNPAVVRDYLIGLGEFEGTYERMEIAPSGDIVVPTVMKRWEG